MNAAIIEVLQQFARITGNIMRESHSRIPAVQISRISTSSFIFLKVLTTIAEAKIHIGEALRTNFQSYL